MSPAARAVWFLDVARQDGELIETPYDGPERSQEEGGLPLPGTPKNTNDLCEYRYGDVMDYLAAMRAFVRSVELGSFSKAAAEEAQKVSTVSRYVSALEADLGATLLNRSTRRLHLTEAGTAFYGRAAAILANVEDARLATMSLNATPQGLLRINIPGAFGRRHIVPHLKDFRDAYADIRLDITLTDMTVDLIETGTDVAVRIGALADSTLVAKRLAPQRRLLVCSPGYLAKQGPLDEPGDLARRECLTFALQPTDAWYFCKPGDAVADTLRVKVSGSFRANDSGSAAARGHGGHGHRPAAELAAGGRHQHRTAGQPAALVGGDDRPGTRARHMGGLPVPENGFAEGPGLFDIFCRAFRQAALLGPAGDRRGERAAGIVSRDEGPIEARPASAISSSCAGGPDDRPIAAATWPSTVRGRPCCPSLSG